MQGTRILTALAVTVLATHGAKGNPLSRNQISEVHSTSGDAESRLSVGELIQSSGYFPVQVNVPDALLSLWEGAAQAVTGAAQAWPFTRPWARPEQPRPLASLVVLLPARLAGRTGTFLIPVVRQDAPLRGLPFDIDLHVKTN